MKILVVNDYDSLYSRFWGELGDVTTRIPEFMADPESFGLVCFTGGEDISPELYGHKNLESHNSLSRDKREALIFEAAHKHEIPMTGICRGSQFLNVMCGGTMVQHLAESHGGGRHMCQTTGDKFFEVTSSHHQMSIPGEGGEVLAWAEKTLGLDQLVYGGDLYASLNALGSIQSGFPMKRLVARVTEAFAYPNQKIFAVQHHPEWQDIDCEAAQWTLRKIREICLGKTDFARTAD